MTLWVRARPLLFRAAATLIVFGTIELAAWIALQRLELPTLPADIATFLGEAASGQPSTPAGPHLGSKRLTAQDVEPMVDPNYKRVNGSGPTIDEVIHPYVGFVLTPMSPSQEAFSDLGWLRQVLYKRADDQIIVALMGGSVARQLTELGGEALIKELEISPRFKGKRIIVVGLNMGGFKQPQQLMTLNYLLALGGEFDLVINVDGFNEVALHEAENGKKGVFPIFPRWWQGRVNDVSSATMRVYAGELAYLRRQLREVSSGNGLFAHLQVGKVWRAFQIRRLYQDINRVVNNIVSSDSGRARRYVASGPQWEFNDEQLYDHLVDIWYRSSLQMHYICRGNGIQYYHFLQPNQYVEGSKPMGEEERRRALDPAMRYRPGAVKGYPGLIRAGAELKARGVAFTDLTRIFSGRDAPAYADTCCHLLPEATVDVAKVIAHVIMDGKEP